MWKRTKRTSRNRSHWNSSINELNRLDKAKEKIANIRWIMEKAREFQKNIYFCYAKAFDCVDYNKLWKILIIALHQNRCFWWSPSSLNFLTFCFKLRRALLVLSHSLGKVLRFALELMLGYWLVSECHVALDTKLWIGVTICLGGLFNFLLSFPDDSMSKESTCNTGDTVWLPGSGRSPGERYGNPLLYSCLENPMGRGAFWATVHGVTKWSDRT